MCVAGRPGGERMWGIYLGKSCWRDGKEGWRWEMTGEWIRFTPRVSAVNWLWDWITERFRARWKLLITEKGSLEEELVWVGGKERIDSHLTANFGSWWNNQPEISRRQIEKVCLELVRDTGCKGITHTTVEQLEDMKMSCKGLEN